MKHVMNKPVDQIQADLVACHELAVDYNTLPYVLYDFEYKLINNLIHSLHTHIVIFWHISNTPQ